MLKEVSISLTTPDIRTDIITGVKIYRPGSFKQQLIEVHQNYLGFLFQVGKENAELSRREFLLNRLASKRSILAKLNNPLTKLGFLIVFIVITWAIFAPWISLYDYHLISSIDITIDAFIAPSWPEHPLGVTFFGRDVFSRLIWGARSSLTLGIISIAISTILGVLIGVFAAYHGGWVDNFIMRLMDIIMAFPGLIMIIITLSIVNDSDNRMQTILLLYGFLGIPGYARLIRGSVLSEKSKLYIEAAKVGGSSNTKVIFRHILPNCIAPIIVAVTFAVGGTILSLAGLSFLGYGDMNMIEWGGDINYARQKLYIAPWAAMWPGLGIFITVLGFMLIGDGLRDALDPRLQNKR